MSQGQEGQGRDFTCSWASMMIHPMCALGLGSHWLWEWDSGPEAQASAPC